MEVGNTTYHFKILVPAVAAGAIIGKGGETIAQLQRDAGARVKMSKAHDFYPGTSERVCLISGTVEGILQIHEFIMDKIKEKPDPNAKMAIDFDHKQPAEREKQVKILVPNSTAGMIIGKGGSYIKQIKEESGAYVQISQKSKDHALAERCITVIGEMESNKAACTMILAKIVEDANSGTCLNVSYADVTGPVANFNPTGSPFANSGPNSATGLNNSNPSYSSNGSLNSLSPSVTNSFSSPQGGATPAIAATATGIMPFTSGSAANMPPSNTSQVIESIKMMLRGNGFSEQATSEIAAAMNTLANYGVLGLAINLLNSINGPPMMGMGLPNAAAATGGNAGGQGLCPASSPATGMPGLEGPNSGGPTMPNSSMFGPIGSLGNGMSNLSLGFNSPSAAAAATRSAGDRFTMAADGSMFEPFPQNSSALGSPGDASLPPINNNSFGLGTNFNAGGGAPMCKSPSLSDSMLGSGDLVKLDIEVGENIVGAILGPGGKSLVDIQNYSGASIQISKKGTFAPGTRNRIVSITGNCTSVNSARGLIEQMINNEEMKRRQNNMRVLR
ncbi:NOVA1 [Cordylochernes scorpioides]|uniref:NOVA1 n=1 Tax=Cordylochernes scorpioides TaxID=51811 RepID=A0ABY6L2L3_9ARAC|nr:NOVA1 [Cordylochernes scorpioides]